MILARRSDSSPMWAPGGLLAAGSPGGRERIVGADPRLVVGIRLAPG